MAPRTIFVVGANRGIGFSIVQRLATESPDAHLLIGARDVDKGRKASDELRRRGIKSKLDVVKIDITSDESIYKAEQHIRETFGRLDVLINNAAVAKRESLADLRDAFRQNFDSNVASVILTCEIFLPLLRETSSDPRIIQVSSARASLTRTQASTMPPSRVISYNASKAALNLIIMELSKREGNSKVIFQCTSPGHCRTDFNNNTGHKDPYDGAKVIVELTLEKRGRTFGFWEIEGNDADPTLVPW